MKTCAKCREQKPLDQFGNSKRYKDGKKCHCKACHVKETLQHRNSSEKNKENARLASKKWHQKRTVEQIKQHNMQSCLWRSANAGKAANAVKAWHIANPEYQKKYAAQRRQTDYVYKFKNNIRTLIRQGFNNLGHKKNTKTTQILGCNYDFFINYLEKKFQPNMNWDNRNKWHIDHIIPISTAKTIAEVIELNHYTNLQPLWAKDNLKKGAKHG
jgi:hypothetical protein